MKKLILFPAALLLIITPLSAQQIPVQTVTVFKNNRAMIERSGPVKATNSLYSTNDLPNALNGTFWLGTPENAIKYVFTTQDSVEKQDKMLSRESYYRQLIGKKVNVKLLLSGNSDPEVKEGTFESISNVDNTQMLLFKSVQGVWTTVYAHQILQVNFTEQPQFNFDAVKTLQKRMDIQFNNAQPTQMLNLAYLTNNLGWSPVYRLVLDSKNKGDLSMRAEVVNDAEDLGNTVLRLAVGNPNFKFAGKYSSMVDFYIQPRYADDDNSYAVMQNYQRPDVYNYLSTASAGGYDASPAPAPLDPEGSQAEDFFYYTIRPGDFPKGSRYQFPVFETEVVPVHFYESTLSNIQLYTRNQPAEHPVVTHFMEFKNTTEYPWTTGIANVLSEGANGGLQPVSQDVLPYTAPGGKCKVRIADAPQILVTQNAGEISRGEKTEKVGSSYYTRLTIEGEIAVVNYKTDPVVLKVNRVVDGKPTVSNEVKWSLKQESITLAINPQYKAEWEVTLKPGEEKKWKYQYEVLVNF